MRILFVGDVVGRPGRDAVEGLLHRESGPVDFFPVGDNARDRAEPSDHAYRLRVGEVR